MVNICLRTRRKSLARDQTWRTEDRETEAVTLCGLGEKQQTGF